MAVTKLGPKDFGKFKKKPLDKVHEKKPIFPQVFDSTEEEIEAYNRATDVEVARIEYEEAKEGKVPKRLLAKWQFWTVIGGLLTATSWIAGCFG